ncbi:MAG: Nif3-like dinuclear metal center hexameric protein [Bacteroidota bacterium]|nr:Nif3-like dinuclear metal center hexameric protein [Bacteroidota bacterium]
MLHIRDILSGLLEWAPASLAWERDNIGLLVGAADDEVRRVLVCLDITPAVVEEAVAREATCIVAHHPVIFHPLTSLRTDRHPGSMYAALLRAGISVIAMHTNVDAARTGLNHALADLFDLRGRRRLDAVRGQRRLLTVRLDAAAEWEQTQEFAARRDDVALIAQYAEGGRHVLQFDLPSWEVDALRARLRASYGDVPVQVTALEDTLSSHGIGVVGEIDVPMQAEAFLATVKQKLGCSMLRCTPFDAETTIRRVAVSSGAGGSYVRSAVSAGADALVTGDLTHHTFLDYARDILLVDAGHYETEQLFIRLCAEELERRVFDGKQKIDILRTQTDTNPVRFV